MTSPKEQRRHARLQKSLQLSTPPAFTDPRIKRRAEKVLDFAYDLMLRPKSERGMKATEYYKVIGTIGRGPSAYFDTLFRKIGYYTKGTTYIYSPIEQRVQRCANAIGYTNGLVRAANRKGYSFLNDPGPRAALPRTGSRLYPWWSWMKKEVRFELFLAEHGKGYDYDIEAAKPTVTLQAWKKLMREHKPEALEKAECKLPAWTALVADRRAYREKMAREVGITVEQAKDVCQIVLNSGYASPVKKNAICETIGEEATKRLMDSKMYVQLRADFRTFWQELKGLGVVPDMLFDLRPGEAVSEFYNKIEDEVMSVVANELANQRVWFIHDGFMTTEQVDVKSIEQAIMFHTGYDIKLEETDLCKSER